MLRFVIADQFYWGKRVHELGVGLAPIPRAKLDRDRLAVSLDGLVQSEEMRVTASGLGAQIRSEEGAANAVQVIEEVFG